MAATIGTSDLEKNIKRGTASGHVMVKGITATPIDAGKAKFTPVDKAAAPAFAVVVDSRGEKRVKRVPGTKAEAEATAKHAAMKNADATCYLAQRVGKGEGGDVFQILGSFKRA